MQTEIVYPTQCKNRDCENTTEQYESYCPDCIQHSHEEHDPHLEEKSFSARPY